MSLFSIFARAYTWLKKEFTDHIVDAPKVAVFITETIKGLLANPVTGFLINVADAVTSSQVPTDIANYINALIPKVLAVELSIEGLPENATPEQVLAFEQEVLKAFNVTGNNSKLYTELASQVYGIIQTNIKNGKTKFTDWINAVELAYTDYQKDLNANAPVIAPAPAAVAVVEPEESSVTV